MINDKKKPDPTPLRNHRTALDLKRKGPYWKILLVKVEDIQGNDPASKLNHIKVIEVVGPGKGTSLLQ